MPPFFWLFMQCLALDATKMVELQEEVTRAQVTVVVAGVRATQAERMAQEKAVLLATARGEMDEVAQSASILEDELVVARWARDATEEKIRSLAAKVVAANQQR
jgi:ABC-type phosphate transport system ATPase subunit